MMFKQNNKVIPLNGWFMDGNVKRPSGLLKLMSDSQLLAVGVERVEALVSEGENLKKVFSLDEWMARFNQDELIKYYQLIASGDIEVIALNQTLLTHTVVDIESSQTINGLALLEFKSVISAERKTEMMTPQNLQSYQLLFQYYLKILHLTQNLERLPRLQNQK